MTIIKHLGFTLAATFFLLIVRAQAQTPSIEVTSDSHQARFALHGEAQQMRVEVFAPSGEMVHAQRDSHQTQRCCHHLFWQQSTGR